MGFISEWRDFRMNDAHPAHPSPAQTQTQTQHIAHRAAKPHPKAHAGNFLPASKIDAERSRLVRVCMRVCVSILVCVCVTVCRD